MKTKLKTHIIHFDGTLELEPEVVPTAFLKGISPLKIMVSHLTEDIDEFNKRSDVKIRVALDNYDPALPLEWNIPNEYLNINIRDYIFNTLIKNMSEDRKEERISRLEQEYSEFKNRGLENLLRAIIFIFDEFRRKKVLWGVGRGSSCSSYILYLIGVHSVDPIKYNIPLSEFFHD